jgi:DNA-binding YbaB/EbfC family protein
MSLPFEGDGLEDLLAQMQQLQASVEAAEEQASSHILEGTAAGGAIRIRVAGEFSFESVTIDPSVVNPTDVGLLEDLILAALRDAVTQLTAARRAAMGDVVHHALAGLLGVDDGQARDVDEDVLDIGHETHDTHDDETGGSGLGGPGAPGLSG